MAFPNSCWLGATPDHTNITATIILDIFLTIDLLLDSRLIRVQTLPRMRFQRYYATFAPRSATALSYYPQTDGKSDVCLTTLCSHKLELLCHHLTRLIETNSPLAFALNSAPLYDTEVTPFYSFYLRQPPFPHDIAFNTTLLGYTVNPSSKESSTQFARQPQEH